MIESIELEAYTYIDQIYIIKIKSIKTKFIKQLRLNIYEYNYRNLFADTSNLISIPEKKYL